MPRNPGRKIRASGLDLECLGSSSDAGAFVLCTLRSDWKLAFLELTRAGDDGHLALALGLLTPNFGLFMFLELPPLRKVLARERIAAVDLPWPWPFFPRSGCRGLRALRYTGHSGKDLAETFGCAPLIDIALVLPVCQGRVADSTGPASRAIIRRNTNMAAASRHVIRYFGHDGRGIFHLVIFRVVVVSFSFHDWRFLRSRDNFLFLLRVVALGVTFLFHVRG
mmetsp:Transcript_5475/g.16134  ORF Transcript_5475/g.16134 Transcript_5475/m.16134 type:complete len:223 (-) Transcript_5475:413-1081(-)